IPVTAAQPDAALPQAQDSGLSHRDFRHRLLADQAGLRRQRSIERRVKEAHCRDRKPLAAFDGSFTPALNRVQIETLAWSDFVRRRRTWPSVGHPALGKGI